MELGCTRTVHERVVFSLLGLAIERKLLNELDDQPRRIPVGNGDKGHGRQHENESTQPNGTNASNSQSRVIADASTLLVDGFLF